MDIDMLNAKYNAESENVKKWCQTEYLNNFSEYFDGIDLLYERLKSNYRPVTDAELEQILTEIPLQLFGASEALSSYKAKLEVLKLKVKLTKHEIQKTSLAATKTERAAEASYQVMEDETLIKLYSTIIERVEHQISFSKELIMSAKKIWTARRDTEAVGAGSDNLELPDYSSLASGNSYIKGV